ncbi:MULTISPECIES: glycerophosphodiester phosphodiesterase [Actinokineospora]|uniref:Glycerophosphoryl diester phosphodiesterase n=1 Tax=Actinokineospora fastidiosa TaxID=1816 RepID=A0A918LBQ7_9PSEU|nr:MULTISPECIES: glycerophosphodiester phosphodiesterase [Actinokineospora]UVS79354.1 Glycerophosphoryl diester phosphodiesterase [Actinokineospora sp. UTMC 2448]GGS27860.1 glycerophosphoryl diester phosphodiesterase [Actinokineospora fastidiosa]
MPTHGFLTGPHPRAFVHRGWHSTVPGDDMHGMENSLAAFRRAVAEGYRYIETDVHATSDGVVVVQHDPRLDRTTDATGEVGALPWSTVRQARIGGREPVARLEDVLEELPEALFNIDVKADAAVEPLLDVLRRTNAADRVCVASFSEARLARVRRLAGPSVLTSMGMRAMALFWASGRLPALPLGRSPGRPPLAQVPVRHGALTVVDRRLVAAARRRGGEVHVWTIDEPEEMHRLLDLGVDGLMTDRPRVLKDVLIERGAWARA